MWSLENLQVWDIEAKKFTLKTISIQEKDTEKKKTIDCKGLLGIPVGMDIHVHFREPGYPHKEDFTSGAKAATHGGLSAVLDMPNTLPVTDRVEALIKKRELAKKQQLVDVFLAAAITDKNLNMIEQMYDYCDAFKVFMSESFGSLSITQKNIEKALSILAKKGLKDKPIYFHAEDPEILKRNSTKKDHYEQRPPEAEALAVQQIVKWAEKYPTLHLHITHVSSSLAVKTIKTKKIMNITTDTCARYLYLNKNSDLDYCKKKVNPPLREEKDSQALINALSQGIIDMISSDHSPHTIDEKKDQATCPSGMPGVQELLPSLINLVKKEAIEWKRAIEAYYIYPNRLFGKNVKGLKCYEEGNIVIIDINEPYSITKDWIQSKCGWSPFEGRTFYGKFKHVFVKGIKVI